jgi:hypothetical protein
VTYALNAISRFRKYFDDADPAPFSVRTVLPSPVNIRSSARPSPPVILSVRPAFAWEETRVDGPAFQLKRHRLPGRLRIELKGGWFETGEGECLGLLLSKDGMPNEAMAPFLTRAGGDPIIMGTFNIPILFPTAAAAVGDGPAREVPLAEAPAPVVVVPFNPWFYTPTPPSAPGDARWLVDIALPGLADPGTNAWPFVEMAVARYQPNSLPGLELSRVVKAEMSQALPERFLSVRRSGNDLFVTYHGLHDEPNPEFAAQNLFVVVLERFQAAPGTLADAVELTALAPPVNPPVPPPTDGLPAWVAVDNQLHQARVGPQELRIPIPAGLTGPLRLRIRESEEDDGAPGLPFDDNGELTARTVYSDIIPLT